MVDSRSLFYPVPRFNPSPTVSNFIDLAGLISVKISTAEFGFQQICRRAQNGIALIFGDEEQRRRQHGGIEVLLLKLEEPLRNIPASDTDQLHVPVGIQPIMLQDSSRNVISRSHGP